MVSLKNNKVNIIKFLKSRIFLISFGIFIVGMLLFLFIGLRFLNLLTHHGEALTVPDLTGYSIEEVDEVLKSKKLRYEVIDSMYRADVPFFTVIEQNPKPMSKVKRNRKIYLTISSDIPPKVKVPNLIDVTLRQAVTILKGLGLLVGDLEYVPDIAQNVVLKMKKDGRIIKPGTSIPKGSTIDLILGDGLSSQKTYIIPLTGLTLEEAMIALSLSYLNIGAIMADNSVKDTLNAIVYKQYPAPSDVEIAQGESVDVWVTHSENFKKMNLQRVKLDSLNFYKDE